MGEKVTLDFLLRHVFDVAAELIKTTEALLHALLLRHYSGRACPRLLDDHLISRLRDTGRWSTWPLEEIVPKRAAFQAAI